MALTWDLTEIENHKALWIETNETDSETGEPLFKLDPVTECLIWISIATGMGDGWKLTRQYAPEFYARVKMLEKIGGPLLTRGSEPYDITWDDVKRHVGLQTNAGKKTRAEFVKNLVHAEMDDLVRKAQADPAPPKTFAV